MQPGRPGSAAELRYKVLQAHQQYIPAVKKLGLVCPGCGQYITAGWDPHEWLVKRSAVPVPLQHLILVPENVIPIHHKCHNNSKELTRKCLTHLARSRTIALANIGRWYVSLWLDHGLSVPRGILYPPRDLPLSVRLRLFNQGCKLLGIEIKDWQADSIDIRGVIAARWIGKTRSIPKLPREWQGIPVTEFYKAMSVGYWYDYLSGVIG